MLQLVGGREGVGRSVGGELDAVERFALEAAFGGDVEELGGGCGELAAVVLLHGIEIEGQLHEVAGAEGFGGVAPVFAGLVVDRAAASAGRFVDPVDSAVDDQDAVLAGVQFDILEFALDGARAPVGFGGGALRFGLAGLFEVVEHLAAEAGGDAGGTELAFLFGLVELCGGDFEQRIGVVGVFGPVRAFLVEPALHPGFEDLVHEAAAIEDGEFAAFFGLFDGVDAEDVGEEEAVGAGGVALEGGGGEGALAVEGVPEVAGGADEAVEFGELGAVAPASGDVGALGGEAADFEQQLVADDAGGAEHGDAQVRFVERALFCAPNRRAVVVGARRGFGNGGGEALEALVLVEGLFVERGGVGGAVDAADGLGEQDGGV